MLTVAYTAILLATLSLLVVSGFPPLVLAFSLLLVTAFGLKEMLAFSVSRGRYPCQVRLSQQRWSFDYVVSEGDRSVPRSVAVECANQHFICSWFVVLKYRYVDEVDGCCLWSIPLKPRWRYLLVAADTMPALSFHRFRLAVRFYSH